MTRRPALLGDELPELVVPPPGPRSRGAAKRLRAAEGAAIWGVERSPIVWKRAKGSVVEDLDGNRYVDLTSGFGAATLGHAAPAVARAVAAQARAMAHGLGDLHPHAVRVELVRRLAALGGALARILLAGTGSEAVELALKTAALATGRRRVVAFEGGYHGQLGAALEVTHEPPSAPILAPAGPPRAIRIAYPNPARCPARRPCPGCDLACLDRGWETVARECRGDDPPGAVIVEPIQGRAGVIVPPPEFLPRLRAYAREAELLVIHDEILTGAGRTGPFWAWERSGPDAAPDLMTVGKGIGGGVAIGALLGRPELMDVWSRQIGSSGEAPYASTFYAHPLACAGTLAALKRLTAPDLAASVLEIGRTVETRLSRLAGLDRGVRARSVGAMAAVDLPGAEGTSPAEGVAAQLAARGILVVPGGPNGSTISLLPAFTIGSAQLDRALDAIEELAAG